MAPANDAHGSADILSHCPDCGQLLVRPPDFSADRLLYLHRKWGPCFPAGAPAADRARGVPAS